MGKDGIATVTVELLVESRDIITKLIRALATAEGYVKSLGRPDVAKELAEVSDEAFYFLENILKGR